MGMPVSLTFSTFSFCISQRSLLFSGPRATSSPDFQSGKSYCDVGGLTCVHHDGWYWRSSPSGSGSKSPGTDAALGFGESDKAGQPIQQFVHDERKFHLFPNNGFPAVTKGKQSAPMFLHL